MKDIRNLSIFSSSGGWKTFLRTAACVLVVLFLGSVVFIMVVDPYASIPFSPDWERSTVGGDQRLFYPNLARAARFDSAIVGTSSGRLLRPEDLNKQFASRFVNLCLNSASVYEQESMLNIFLAHHPHPKTVIFGIDHVYVDEKYNKPHIEPAFEWPEWLYDQNPFNNFPPYRLHTLTHAWRQFLSMTGLKTYKYGRDGYTDFTRPMDEYDLNRARMKIYGTQEPKPVKAVFPPAQMSSAEIDAFKFPNLAILVRMLRKLPHETVKILVLMPAHHFIQPAPGSADAIHWQEFLRRLTKLTRNLPGGYILNFNIPSPITTQDANYWDGLHYTVVVAAELVSLIAEGVQGTIDNANYVRLVANKYWALSPPKNFQER
ncbi:MAG: hypothetical protein U9Q05_06240 [Thermodesulfobacteriota bacterium]|nr:hypothetical protein [Thermodesulfobacteriota bacterium]